MSSRAFWQQEAAAIKNTEPILDKQVIGTGNKELKLYIIRTTGVTSNMDEIARIVSSIYTNNDIPNTVKWIDFDEKIKNNSDFIWEWTNDNKNNKGFGVLTLANKSNVFAMPLIHNPTSSNYTSDPRKLFDVSSIEGYDIMKSNPEKLEVSYYSKVNEVRVKEHAEHIIQGFNAVEERDFNKLVNMSYRCGYSLAHELLHQMLLLAESKGEKIVYTEFEDRRGHTHKVDGKRTLNLNMSQPELGSDLTLKRQNRDAETILKNHREIIKKLING